MMRLSLLPRCCAAVFGVGFLFLTALATRAAISPGEILIGEMNCVACHSASQQVLARLASRPSPRLTPAHAARVTPQWMRAFLENPQATQPGTLMPDLLAGLDDAKRAEAAESLTHYLIALRGEDKTEPIGASTAAINDGQALYHSVGCVTCHAPDELVPEKSNDADAEAELDRLRQISVPLGALEKKYTVSALADFLEDPLKSRPGGRMPSLKLKPAEARAIAMYLLRAQVGKAEIEAKFLSHEGPPMRPVGDAMFAVDPGKAAHGKELFASLNCAGCHQVDGPGRTSKPLVQLNARQPGGCLATKPKEGVPKFAITDRQRVVILAQLGSQAELEEALTPEQQITRTMTTLNCYACHSRERRGGVEGLRRDYLTSVGETDLSEEGRIPPALTGIGAKLRPEGIKSVLVEGGAVRLHMATRMPLYGEKNVGHLPALFEKADVRPGAQPDRHRVERCRPCE